MGKDLDKFFKNKLENRSFEFKEAYWEDALRQIEAEDKKASNNNITKWLLSLFFFAMLSFGLVYGIQQYSAAQFSDASQMKSEPVPPVNSEHQQPGLQALNNPGDGDSNKGLTEKNINDENKGKDTDAQLEILKPGAYIAKPPEKLVDVDQDDYTDKKDLPTFNNNVLPKRQDNNSNARLHTNHAVSLDAETGRDLTYPEIQKALDVLDNEDTIDENEEHNQVLTDNYDPGKANIRTDVNPAGTIAQPENAGIQKSFATTENFSVEATNEAEKVMHFTKQALINKTENKSGENSVNSINDKTVQLAKADREEKAIVEDVRSNNKITKHLKVGIFLIAPLPTRKIKVLRKSTDNIKLEIAPNDNPDYPFEISKKKKHLAGVYTSALFNPQGIDRKDVLNGYKIGLFSRLALGRKLGLRAELLYGKRQGNLPFVQNQTVKQYGFGSTTQNLILLPNAFHVAELGLYLDYTVQRHHFGLGANLDFLAVVRGNLAQSVDENSTTDQARKSNYLSAVVLPESSRINDDGFEKLIPELQLYYGFELTRNLQLHLRSNFRLTDMLENIKSNETALLEDNFSESLIPTTKKPVRLNFEIGLGYNFFKF